MHNIYFLISILLIIFLYKLYPKFKLGLFIISIATTTIYLMWRVFFTIPQDGINLVLGIILYACEVISFIYFLINNSISSTNKNINKEVTEKYEWNELPTVDIFIPTYGEPIYILKNTILATLAIEYDNKKKQVYVCDDSKRLEVKTLCEQLKVNYIIRLDNDHAKAGNLNNALEYSSGELTVVFDADMIAHKDFLIKSVHYFKNSEIGFVQIPQSFYNLDIFQLNSHKKIQNEQDYFMRVIQANREKRNSAIHVGTNAIFKRSILNEVHKYPTISITEDIVLGFLIQAKGYKTILLNEVLAVGLNPTNLKDLIKQRDRWCRGNLQLLSYILKNINITKKLKANQIISYVGGILFWYGNVLTMIFILLPIIMLLFGTTLMRSSILDIVLFYTPLFLSQYLLFKRTVKNTRSWTYAHIVEKVYSPYICKSIVNHFIKKDYSKDFNVTNKEIRDIEETIYIRQVIPHIVLIILTLISWGVGVVRGLDNPNIISFLSISFLWTLYNIIPMIIMVKISMKRVYPYEISVELKKEKYLELREESKVLKLLISNISEGKIIINQVSDRILLKGENVTLYLDDNFIKGEVVKATAGKAIILINEISEQADIDLSLIYIENLQPYYIYNESFDE